MLWLEGAVPGWRLQTTPWWTVLGGRLRPGGLMRPELQRQQGLQLRLLRRLYRLSP